MSFSEEHTASDSGSCCGKKRGSIGGSHRDFYKKWIEKSKQVTKRRQERNQEMKHQHGRKKHMQQAVHSLPCAWTDQPGKPLVVHWSRPEQLQTKPNADGTGRDRGRDKTTHAWPVRWSERDETQPRSPSW